MKKKSKLGKVILNHKGYSVRPLLNNGLPIGKFGIYAGKKLEFERDFFNKEDIISVIDREITDNTNDRIKAEQAHSRKMKELNFLTRRTW